MNTLTRYGVLAALAAGLSFNSWLEGWSLGVFLFVVWIFSHGNFLYLMYHTLGRDLRYDSEIYFVCKLLPSNQSLFQSCKFYDTTVDFG